MSYLSNKSPPRKEYNVYPKNTQQSDLINLILKSQMQRNAYLNQSQHYR